jgi:hypothetical protein
MHFNKYTDHIIKLTFLILLLISVIQFVQAQKFGGGLILGFNASQIDGDELAGYHKIGWDAGLNTSYNLNDPWQINLDLLLSQRGSRTSFFLTDNTDIRKITLNYLEMPLYLSYKDWEIEDDFYKVQGFAGLSYGQLFSVKNLLGEDDINSDNFLKNDLSYIIGAKLMFSRYLGISGRYTRSFLKLYKNPDDGTKSLNSYFLNFSIYFKIL